jgi:hypothetical protein
MQGVCKRFAFMSKLVGNGGKDTDLGLFLGIVASRESCTQDGVLINITILLVSFGYGIRYGGLAGTSLTGQPEDTRAVL